MEVVLITGSAELIGAESSYFFANKGYKIVGVDNNMRKVFFRKDASTDWSRKNLQREIKNYIHYDEDIRDKGAMENIFKEYGEDIKLVIHTAAQPSHDWAVRDPFTDFTVNANGTLILLTENCDELEDYFTIGKDLDIFTNKKTLLSKIKYYLKSEAERESIAKNGYERVLKDHTYEKRFLDILNFID